jgi:hypothetical protein
MRRLVLIAALVGVAFAVVPGVASAFSCGVSLDKFNRADSANLGPNWAEQTNPNNVAIAGNAATNSASTQALATYNPRSAREACIDVSTGGTGLQYAAIVLRHGDLDNSVFIKVQNQDGDNTFELAYFYRGNNGQGGTLMPQRGITAPFSSGRIHVWSKGTKARLDIDTDFDNKPEQSFNVSGIATGGLGTLIGVGAFGGAIIDNFRTAPPQTTITKHPSKTTSSHSATFKFKSSISGSHFKCKLDGQSYKSCGSPRSYSGLSSGNHTFRVKAIDAFGNPDPTPAKFRWHIT